jgi:uncharacterized protein
MGWYMYQRYHTPYITDPNEALKLNQKVTVKVLEVDTVRKRIALSIKQTLETPAKKQFTKGNMRDSRSTTQNNNAAKKPITEMPLNDALAALKQKFGK